MLRQLLLGSPVVLSRVQGLRPCKECSQMAPATGVKRGV